MYWEPHKHHTNKIIFSLPVFASTVVTGEDPVTLVPLSAEVGAALKGSHTETLNNAPEARRDLIIII